MFSKPLIIALLISISMNCLFGYLSYSFYSDKAVLQSQLDTAVDANKGLQESLDKKDSACKITDVIVGLTDELNPGESVYGNLTENILAKCETTTIIYRSVQPIATVKRYIVVIPERDLKKAAPDNAEAPPMERFQIGP